MTDDKQKRISELTPYDTGERLEPQLWVRGGIVPGSEGTPRDAEVDDYGRVDFDNDASETIRTLHVRPHEHGYEVRIEQLTSEYVLVTGAEQPPVMWGPARELSLDYRAQQMDALAYGLRDVAAKHEDHIRYYDDGDPFAFHPGNFVFHPHDRDGTSFAIEELYARAMDWNDPVNFVPIGWQWFDYRLIPHPDGSREYALVASGTVIPSDIDALIDRADDWAAVKTRELDADAAEAVTHTLDARSTPEGPRL